jgi:deoxyribonuclease V
MQLKALHSWNVTYLEAVGLQEMLRERLILRDPEWADPVRIVAGADISYARRSDRFFAAVVLFSYPDLKVIEVATAVETVSFPYIPGLLSFREGPALAKAFELLTLTPDIIIFDGQGIAHPRGIGLASHMGLLLNVPSIGCAKSLLVGQYREMGEEAGAWSHLVYKDRIVGAALRTKKKVKPVFVSQGHKTGLERALAMVMTCCRGYRLPEPTRQAHLAVNLLRAKSEQQTA